MRTRPSLPQCVGSSSSRRPRSSSRTELESIPTRQLRRTILGIGIGLGILALEGTPTPLAGPLSPDPQVRQLGSGSLSLSGDYHILRDDSLHSVQMDSLVAFMDKLLQNAGYNKTTNSGTRIILHRFLYSPPASLPTITTFAKIGTEGYALVVDQSGSQPRLTVAAMAQHGVFNGAMTVSQLLLTDAGGQESAITPQTIQDYPDHPIRGAHWSWAWNLANNEDARGIQLWVCNNGTPRDSLLPCRFPLGPNDEYCFTDEMRDKIDFLARHKVNLLIYQPSWCLGYDLATNDDLWLTHGGGAAFAQLADYCVELNRFAV